MPARKILLAQLEVNQDANELVVDYAKGQGARVVLNPAPIHAVSSEFLCKADVITPNEVEASALSGIPIKTPDDALRAARILMDKGVKSVVITLGKQGVLAVTENQSRLFRNYDVKVVDSTGAGDAFNGGLVTALSEGKKPAGSLRLCQCSIQFGGHPDGHRALYAHPPGNRRFSGSPSQRCGLASVFIFTRPRLKEESL